MSCAPVVDSASHNARWNRSRLIVDPSVTSNGKAQFSGEIVVIR
jgi:hypothetical protein